MSVEADGLAFEGAAGDGAGDDVAGWRAGDETGSGPFSFPGNEGFPSGDLYFRVSELMKEFAGGVRPGAGAWAKGEDEEDGRGEEGGLPDAYGCGFHDMWCLAALKMSLSPPSRRTWGWRR